MTYRERGERRAERLRTAADRREQQAASLLKQNEPYRGDTAFNTQPGHIPERARAIRRDERAYGLLSEARGQDARASGIEAQLDRAIYRDDPDALARLQERIDALEARREAMRAANAAFRKDKIHRMELAALPSAYQRDQAMPHQSYELTNIGADIRRNRQRLAQLSAPHVPRSIAARRDGECPACDDPIRAGGTITETEPGRWVHASCA